MLFLYLTGPYDCNLHHCRGHHLFCLHFCFIFWGVFQLIVFRQDQMLVFSIVAVDCTGQDSMVLATSCIPYPPKTQLPNCPTTAEESVPGTKPQKPKPQPKSQSLHHSLNHSLNHKGDFLSPRNAAGECEGSPGFGKVEIAGYHHLGRLQPKPQKALHLLVSVRLCDRKRLVSCGSIDCPHTCHI